MTYSNPKGYEQFMGRWSSRLAPLFVRFAGIQDRQRILDVGSGTGSLSRALLAEGERISVVGVDPTEDYVHSARHNIGGCRAAFQVSSAESLPFADASFDAALALLVLQEMADPHRALRQMTRVTRWGGPVAGCLWDFQNGMPMSSLFWQVAEAVAPDAVARRRADHPPTRIGLQELARLWKDAGLSQVRTESLVLTQEFASFEDFWLPYLTGATPLCEFAAAVNRQTGGELANSLRRIVPQVRPDGSFALVARAFAVAGIVGRS